MTYRKEAIMKPEELREKIINFYHICNVKSEIIQNIMDRYGKELSKYVIATPEVVARSLFRQETGRTL